MKNVEIFTSNSAYENGVCIGGYYEIHKIKYLQNAQHLIATVESIVKNNLLYGCDDTILEDVTISCDDPKVVNEVNKYFNGLCGKVKVYVAFNYAQKAGVVWVKKQLHMIHKVETLPA